MIRSSSSSNVSVVMVDGFGFFWEEGKKCRKVFRLVSGSYNYRQEFASTWTCAAYM